MIVTDDNGVDITVYTQAERDADIAAEALRVQTEYEAKLIDKDNHMKTKLDEFQKGMTAQELKDVERDNAIAESKRIAEEANAKVASAEERRINSLKDIAMRKFVGEDPEMKAKFEESWGFVNLDIKDDGDVARKAEMVANMIGLNNSGSGLGNMPMGGGGGFAPKVSAVEKEKKDAEYSKFKSQLGLDEFLPAQENK